MRGGYVIVQTVSVAENAALGTSAYPSWLRKSGRIVGNDSNRCVYNKRSEAFATTAGENSCVPTFENDVRSEKSYHKKATEMP